MSGVLKGIESVMSYGGKRAVIVWRYAGTSGTGKRREAHGARLAAPASLIAPAVKCGRRVLGRCRKSRRAGVKQAPRRRLKASYIER